MPYDMKHLKHDVATLKRFIEAGDISTIPNSDQRRLFIEAQKNKGFGDDKIAEHFQQCVLQKILDGGIAPKEVVDALFESRQLANRAAGNRRIKSKTLDR